MTMQFENPQAAKLEDQTALDASKGRKIELVAEKAAEKPAKTEQKFDKVNSTLFTK